MAATFVSIKHGACTDSYHDFGHGGKGFNTLRTADMNRPGLAEVVQGLPDPAGAIPVGRVAGKLINLDTLRDEPTMLGELFQAVTINGNSVVPTTDAGLSAGADYNIIQKLIELSAIGSYADANIILPTIEGPIEYKFKILHKTVGSVVKANIKQIGCELDTNDFATFFGGENINLLFDASVINITALIKNCKKASSGVQMLNLKRVINRELINDPAPKTYEEQNSSKSHVNFEIMFETNEADITYSRYANSMAKTNDQQRDKFFSLFDFRIGPLQIIKDKLPKTSVDIIGDGGRRLYCNDNPHENNNIANCWARIQKAFKSSAIKHIESAAYFQCKRSGDWLQALSCLDIGRHYKGNVTTTPAPLPGKKIILVTHDRVLLWYALFMGIDVLMTYKKCDAACRAAAAAAGEEEEEEDDDNTVEALDAEGGPKKPDCGWKANDSERYMLYFSANSRSETPAQRSARLIAEADAIIPLLGVISTWIGEYNRWIANIKARRLAAINTIWLAIKETNPVKPGKAATFRLTGNAETAKYAELLKAYYEFTSLDYVNIPTGIEQRLVASYMAAAAGDKAIAAESLVSYYNTMLYKKNSIPDENSIVIASSSYKHDPLYEHMVSINQLAATRPARSSAAIVMTPQASAAATASFLCQRLPADLVDLLWRHLNWIKINRLSTEIYIIDVFIPIFTVALQAPASRQITAAAETSDAVITAMLTEAVQEERDIKAEAIAAAANQLSKKAKPETSADEALPAPVAPTAANPTPGKRAGVIGIASMGTAVRDFAVYLGRRLRGRVTGYSVAGGGSPSAITSRYLYVVYLRQLMLDLSSFETADDEDYQYYDALARMVLSISTRKTHIQDPNFYNTLEHLLYDVLPAGGWTEAEESAGAVFMRNETFADRVAFVGRQVALHSLDMRTGPLESLGNTGTVPVGAVKVFNDLKVFLREKNFDERQAFLLKELGMRMDYPAPRVQGINLRTTPISLKTGQITPISMVTPPPKAISVGGRRTRRKRQVGGRRSRQTRRKGSSKTRR